MAYEIGSVNGHYALLDAIRLFVETTVPLAQRYVVMREVTTGDDREVIWKAPGYSGDEEIYMGIKTYQSSSSDYYNFKIGVFTGYVSSNTFETQPGTITMIGVPLWDKVIPYVLHANGARIVLSAKIETLYNSFYIGKFLPYATPTQYPYPVFSGGCVAGATNTRYSDTAYMNWFKGITGRALLRKIDGSWIFPYISEYFDPLDYYSISQIRSTELKHQLRNISASSETAAGWYGLLPLVLSYSNIVIDPYYRVTDANADVFGELDGVFYISGFHNSVENTIVHNGIPYYITRDAWRTGFNDYLAIRLD